MFLVILGHVIQLHMYPNSNAFWENPLFKAIYIFHMPLFALISGYFAAKSFEKYQLRAIPRYLIRLALPGAGVGLLTACILLSMQKLNIG